MSRIQAVFEALSRSGRKALIPYITAGDPDPALTVPLMLAMAALGIVDRMAGLRHRAMLRHAEYPPSSDRPADFH